MTDINERASAAYNAGNIGELFELFEELAGTETALAELAAIRQLATEWHADRAALIDPVTGDWDADADGTVWESDDEAVQILRQIAEGAQS